MIVSTLMLMAAGQAAALPAAVQSNPEKIVCKSESVPHSRIPERVCRKQAEWDVIAKQNEDDIRKSANQRQIPGNENGR